MKTSPLVLLFLALGLAACDGSAPIAAAIDAPVNCALVGPTVSPAIATMRAGDTLRARASLSRCNGGATATFLWTSSNGAVADVDSSGLVRARGQGSATILATLNRDASVKGAMAVNVVP